MIRTGAHVLASRVKCGSFGLECSKVPVNLNAMNEDSSVRLNPRGTNEVPARVSVLLREDMDIVTKDGELTERVL